MAGLRDSLSRWRAPRLSQSAFQLTKVAEACSKYDGVPTEVGLADADRRIGNVLRLAEGQKLHQCSSVDLSIALRSLLDDRRLGSATPVGRAVIDEGKRRVDRRALRAIFNCFVATFEPRSELTTELRDHLARHALSLDKRVERFAELNRVLDDGFGVEETARRIISNSDIAAAVRDAGIVGTIGTSRYTWKLKETAVASALAAGNIERLQSALAWLGLDGSDRWGADRSAAYEWLLRPFVDSAVKSNAQGAITKFLLQVFGDPRVQAWPALEGQRAAARAEAYQAVMRRWLALDQLDLFIKIIERTAVERMFKSRRAFWLPYFTKGVVSDVTLIAASDADREARKVNEKTGNGLSWSTLSGAQSDHSVLLLRLDRLVIAEWSHNGKMRFWHDRDEHAPQFHLPQYHRTSLTKGSLAIPGLSSEPDGITHYPDGTWQRRATQTIEFFTGVRP